jgi:hypothetical protein
MSLADQLEVSPAMHPRLCLVHGSSRCRLAYVDAAVIDSGDGDWTDKVHESRNTLLLRSSQAAVSGRLLPRQSRHLAADQLTIDAATAQQHPGRAFLVDLSRP